MGMWQFKSPVLRICSPLAYPRYAKQRASFLKMRCFEKNRYVYSHLDIHVQL